MNDPSKPRRPRRAAVAVASPPRGAPKAGGTQPVRHERAEPRLPHEHDESSDSQVVGSPGSAEVGQQAYDDVERGLVDTDRGAVSDEVYNRSLKPSRPPGKR
jgi:hypothetical protein